MKTRYLVFDDDGIIHSSLSLDDAVHEFQTTDEFKGDLILAEVLNIRR